MAHGYPLAVQALLPDPVSLKLAISATGQRVDDGAILIVVPR